MKRFAVLYAQLDATTSTRAKVEALSAYFREAPPRDAAYALWFLAGNRPKRSVPVRLLAEIACSEAGIPGWLFEECYAAAGDLAETISHLLPDPASGSGRPLHEWVARLLSLKAMTEDERRAALAAWWSELDTPGRFLWNKLVTGEFRVGVSRLLVVRALAEVSGLQPLVITERLAGAWEPGEESFAKLLAPGDTAREGEPYPFFLAHALSGGPEPLGEPAEWQCEWKWDGIRAQLVKRGGRAWLWSRGDELITERFPEVTALAAALADGTVLDGEILAWEGEGPLPFARLQQRIGRKVLSAKALAASPAAFVAYDLLEQGGEDLRALPLEERRRRLDAMGLRTSQVLRPESWQALAGMRARARSLGVEGVMLKRLASPYRAGRPRGDWWKWKLDPMSVDAVLVYAQRGSGRRASLYTDYTFAVWNGPSEPRKLVPFAKAYSGLTDAELHEVDAFIRANTAEKFGPVRTVKPELVCEIGFEGIQASKRHKSGVAVRFPRILRLRPDKTPAQADSVEALRALIEQFGGG